MEYNLNEPWKTLDPWQEEYINTEGNCFLLCGRQVGKTTAASIKFGKRAIENSNKTILMLAYTEKQAYNLFFRTLQYIQAVAPKMIKKGKDKPTQHIIRLTNGTRIMCYAAGTTGLGLVGFTITDLVIDEAASMNREIFILLSPTLSVTKGTMDLISTPKGKEGYFYEASLREDFKKFYVSAEDCPRHDRKFLETERKSMSMLEYAQEYLAIFLDDLKRLFNDDWLEKVCVLKKQMHIQHEFKHYLGSDIARLGGDEITFEILRKINSEEIEQVDSIVKKRQLTTKTADDIIDLEKIYKFRKIGIDDGGVGAPILDMLLRENSTKGKVVGLNNASRSLNKDATHNKKLMKEEMYLNLLSLGDHGKIKLLKDDELILSLKSVQYEYVEKKEKSASGSQLRIFGNYTHIAEGLIRAAWLAVEDKSLSLWAR